MGKARRNSLTDKEGKKLPGPGGYGVGNLDVVRHANPKWSLKGKNAKDRYEKDVPGPGQYEDRYYKHNPPNYTFGNKLSKTFYSDKSAIPGPGSYKSPTTMGKKGGYIAGRPKDRRANDLPGPGQYSLRSTLQEGHAAPFGTGKRSSPNLNKSAMVPGPGSYQPQSDFGNRTHAAGFGTGKKGHNYGDRGMPGPGQYTVNESLFRDNKAASIKGRPQTSKQDMKPGPGHYQSKSISSSPAFTMGVKTRIKELTSKNNPGPGGYNPEFKSVKPSPPGVNFGSPSKSVVGDSSMPGPGQYDVRKGPEGPAYGIRGRYEDPKGDMKPGPGNYNPKDELIRHGTPGTVMGSGQRSNLAGKGDAPGPGNYDVTDHNKGKQFSFGTGNRDDSIGKNSKNFPGPGTYVPPTFIGKDTQGKSIAGRVKERSPDNIPGPGAYASPDKRNGPSYSLSGHRTEDPILREKAKMPPPGSYNPDDSITKHQSHGVSFGSGAKSTTLRGDGTPGPGQYQLKTTLDSKGVHIAGKVPEVVKEKAPGPGAYDPKADLKYKSGPSFSISGVHGDQYMPTKGIPGPGTYDSPERPATSGFKFGSDKRQGLASRGDAPGPGQYTVPTTIGKEGKNIIIAGRYEDKRDVNQVGPGQYQLPSTLSGPKFSMGAGEKGTKLNKDALLNPPPGTYTIDANAGKHHSPGIVFGKDKRDHLKGDSLPGPGNYQMPSTLDSRGITIQGKHEEKIKERAPGPGAYEAKEDPRKTHGGGVKFGHDSKGKGARDTGAPGPGQYKIDQPYDKGPKFGKDLRDKPIKSDMPGPGQYNTRKEEGLTYF